MQIDNADIAAWGVWLPFPQEIRFNRGVERCVCGPELTGRI